MTEGFTIIKFITHQQEICNNIKKGILSNKDQDFLQQVKAELKKYICLIEELEELSNKSFD